ncbi:MAG: right-handed parallel beta-helix repeat-containing protein, partial [Calditrichota bacterium]
MRVHFAVVLALFSLITNAALADTTWVSGGSVSGSWNRAGSPYMLMSGIDIPAGATLSIGPGVTIVFMVSFIFGISNGARLEAMGAEGDSIYFTADTLLNPERWEGLWILGNADTCRMEYCVLEYAATPGYGTCLFEGPTVIRNTTFRHNSAGYGVVLYSYHTDLDLSHCTFEHNTAGSGGVFYVREARGMIHDCLFRANRATDNGGVFQFESQHAGFLVQNCDFIDNTATGNG